MPTDCEGVEVRQLDPWASGRKKRKKKKKRKKATTEDDIKMLHVGDYGYKQPSEWRLRRKKRL